MSRTHILVVDDDEKVTNSVANLLTANAGYTVTQADSGRKAKAVLAQAEHSEGGPVDLVVMDVRMPEMTGLEVLSWLRNHPTLSFTRVIMLTAASSNAEKVDALSAGADDYIVKPYHTEELLARVNTILRTQQLEKQLQRQGAQLETLNRASNAITTTLDFRQIPVTSVTSVCTLLGVELAALFLYDRDKQALICQSLCRRSSDGEVSLPAVDSYPPIMPGVGVIGSVFVNKSLIMLDGPGTDATFVPAGCRIENIAALPLEVRSNPIGVLAAMNKAEESFNSVDMELFGSLGGAVSRAIENANLFRRVRARQQELQESRDRLQAVMDGIRNPIYTIDSSWRLISTNRLKAEQLEVSPSDLVGQLCYSSLFGHTAPCEGCLAARTLTERQAQRWSISWLGEDHLPEEWDVYAYPVPASSPEAAQAVIVWQDRTEERRLENSLLQAGKLAAIGQLAAGVAHEINNPLTAINANAEMLKMFIRPDDENYESVDLIAQAGERAANVVRHLLDFARQGQYAFDEGDINQSIEQALKLASYQFDSAGITVAVQLAADLPRIRASWEHLKTVWLNLLLNARDAIQERSRAATPGKITITTRLSAHRSRIQVLFMDNGVGISKAQQAHVFEPFYTTKAPGSGTGLGLATSHRIIELHGGQMELFSRVDSGTTFVVHLPVSGAENGIPRVDASETTTKA